MKLEVGKSYRTRDGRKAEVKAIDPQPLYSIVGIIETRAYWAQWDENGTNSEDLSMNLISEWVEPEPKKPRLLAWIDVNNGVRLLPDNNLAFADWIRAPWLDMPAEEK